MTCDRNVTWYANWRCSFGYFHLTPFGTKREAELYLELEGLEGKVLVGPKYTQRNFVTQKEESSHGV